MLLKQFFLLLLVVKSKKEKHNLPLFSFWVVLLLNLMLMGWSRDQPHFLLQDCQDLRLWHNLGDGVQINGLRNYLIAAIGYRSDGDLQVNHAGLKRIGCAFGL
jgi:hypothetical protein